MALGPWWNRNPLVARPKKRPKPPTLRPHIGTETHSPAGPKETKVNNENGYHTMRFLAATLGDIQQTRISLGNRIKAGNVAPELYEDVIAALHESEKNVYAALVAAYRDTAPPAVVAWQEATPGVGAQVMARLLGHLGHPRLATPKFWAEDASGKHGDASRPKRALEEGEPFERTVGQLWQYCGHGRAGRREKDMTQEEAFALGNPTCKTLVRVMSEGVVKTQVRKQDDGSRIASGELGEYYLAEKAKYAKRVHTGPCPGGYVPAGPGKVLFAKCKHDGHHAEAGDPFSAGHINSIALRHLGKEILKQLWIAAGAMDVAETQVISAPVAA